MTMTHTDPKEQEIFRLRKEIERLKKAVKKQKYGLVWMDVPEAFEDDVENKLPILREVPELAISNDDGKPTHILIEGDNYHALTCLNYTHKGKIDVIYIDPPYNTGSDGFRYKDKRVLDKFPDGTEVPKDHPFRHSYWLSFMRKRLELAKELLSQEGAIFISIDDNEFAQLKLLCDEVFSEKNFVDCISWEKKSSAKGVPPKNMLVNVHEYVLVYQKSPRFSFIGEPRGVEGFSNPDNDPRGLWRNTNIKSTTKSKSQAFSITDPKTGNIFTDTWAYSKKELDRLIDENYLIFPKNKNGQVRKKEFYSEFKNAHIPMKSSWGLFDNQKNTEMLKSLLGDIIFLNPKPLDLLAYLFKSTSKKNAVILDFFAGSGTTAHAVMKLNSEDDGKRQCVLVTNNEGKIMDEVCYPRIRKVIEGYGEQAGLGGSVKYYRTDFVGKNNILSADDQDKIDLAHHAGELLAIAENTLDQVEKNASFQVFENKGRYAAVYFQETFDQFEDFIEKIALLKKPVSVYVFSWEKEVFINEFEDSKSITVKTIPQPILEIYKQIYNLSVNL